MESRNSPNVPRVVCRLVAVLAAVLLAACATRQPPAPAPLDKLPDEPEALLRRLEGAQTARRRQLHALRSLAQLTYRSADGTQSARHALVAERPDRLRLETLSLFGSMFVLTARGGALTVYVPRESTVYRGTASQSNLARYTRVDLSVPAVVDLLLGTPPLSLSHGVTALALDEGLLRCTETRGGHERAAWFDRNLTLRRYEERDAGGPIARASFADYENVNGIPVASRLDLELPGSDERIELALRDPEVNPDLPDSVFAVPVPAGSREVDLDQAL